MNEEMARNNYERYTSFCDTYYEKIELACYCIDINPCKNLSQKLNDFIESVLNPLLSLDWEDDAGKTFKSLMQESIRNIECIIASIDNDFANSESYYSKAFSNLIVLKGNCANLNLILGRKPNREDYNSMNLSMGDNECACKYSIDCNNWIANLSTQCNKCEGIISEIENCLTQLQDIDEKRVDFSISNSSIGSSNNGLEGSSMVEWEYYLDANSSEATPYFLLNIGDKSYNEFIKENNEATNSDSFSVAKAYTNIINSLASIPIENGGLIQLGATESEEGVILQEVFNDVKDGYSSIIRVSNGEKEFFASIIGVNQNADFDNLKQSDFLVIDPNSSSIIPLATEVNGCTTQIVCSPKENSNSFEDHRNFFSARMQ